MKLSECTLQSVKKAIRVDYSDYDDLIEDIMESARSMLANRIGMTLEELDAFPEIVHAFNCLCADMYDNREIQGTSGKPNPTVETIIAMHRRNYL